MEMDRSYDEGGVPVRGESTKPSDGIYSLSVVGNACSGVRRFFDEMAPKQADSTEVRVAKEVFRWSSVVAWAAFGAVIVLGTGPLGTEPSTSRLV